MYHLSHSQPGSKTTTCAQIPPSGSPLSPVTPIPVALPQAVRCAFHHSNTLHSLLLSPQLRHHQAPFFPGFLLSDEAFGFAERRTSCRNPSRRNSEHPRPSICHLIPFFHPIHCILNLAKLTFCCFLLQLRYLFLDQTTPLTLIPTMTMAERFS